MCIKLVTWKKRSVFTERLERNPYNTDSLVFKRFNSGLCVGPRASLKAVLFTKLLGPLSPPFSLLFNGYQALFSWGGGGGMAAGVWSWPPPPSAEVKNKWNYTFRPQYTFTAWTGTRLLLLSFTNESVRALYPGDCIPSTLYHTFAVFIYTCGHEWPSVRYGTDFSTEAVDCFYKERHHEDRKFPVALIF